MRARMPAMKPPPGGFLPSGRLSSGFTLVELVVVMLLLAVVTAIGASRFADRQPFAVQSAADQIVSGLRIAQASALAQRRTLHVVLGASPISLAVCLDAACTQPLPPPGGDGSWLQETSGLQLAAGASFSFDAAGAPSIASLLAVQVQSSDGAATPRTVLVEPVSGHVHLQ